MVSRCFCFIVTEYLILNQNQGVVMKKKANHDSDISYKTLMQEVEILKKQVSLVRQSEVKSVVEQIHKQMKHYNLSSTDLQLGLSPKRVSPIVSSSRSKTSQIRKSPTQKFKDPVSGTTWSGRSKTPKRICSARSKRKQGFAIAS